MSLVNFRLDLTKRVGMAKPALCQFNNDTTLLRNQRKRRAKHQTREKMRSRMAGVLPSHTHYLSYHPYP